VISILANTLVVAVHALDGSAEADRLDALGGAVAGPLNRARRQLEKADNLDQQIAVLARKADRAAAEGITRQDTSAPPPAGSSTPPAPSIRARARSASLLSTPTPRTAWWVTVAPRLPPRSISAPTGSPRRQSPSQAVPCTDPCASALTWPVASRRRSSRRPHTLHAAGPSWRSDREELAMLTMWMARAVVMLNLAHMRENMLRGRNVMDITGKTALVTGANRGLGRHLAQQLRDRGAKVYAGARNPQSVDLEGVTPIALDITDPTSVAAAADAAGDVSILINNAGISTGTSLLTGDLANIRLEFDTGFFGTLSVIRAFAPQLGAHEGSAVLNILSGLSWISFPQAGAYCAAKSAEWSLTNALRLELAPQGTRVSALHVSYMDTDLVRRIEAPKADPADIAPHRPRRHRSRQLRDHRRRTGQGRPGPPIRRRRRAIPAAPGFAWLSPRTVELSRQPPLLPAHCPFRAYLVCPPSWVRRRTAGPVP
jgi:NAD(P)-dependent dehydrogenase (short-subunit alcohol dehydrogenase family)